MSRPSLAVAALALLAVLSATAVGAGVIASTGPVVSPMPGEPNHLAINASEVAASNTTTASLDVGTAIAADSDSLQAAYLNGSFRRAFENAQKPENRTRVFERTVRKLENVSMTIRERNQAAIEAYARGEISAEAFLIRRARIAAPTDDYLSVTNGLANMRPYQPPEIIGSRVPTLQGRFRVLQGPISSTAADQIIRGGETSPVYVEVSDSGYTLAYVANGIYDRETFLGDEWRSELPDQFAVNVSNPLTAAQSRAAELYPWVVENREAGGGMRGDRIYWTGWRLPSGELSIHLDGGTTNVFKEYQSRTVRSFNTTEVINRTSENLRISVERTYETGPAAVTLRDADSGDPINGTVAIGNRDSVYVGDDGTYWFVEPRDPIRINASAAGTDVSLTLTGFDPATTPGPRTTPATEG